MNTTEMMIHVHRQLDARTRADLEKDIMGHAGVECAEFNQAERPHALVVTYDPDTVGRMEILDMVRTLDPDAITMGC